MIWRPASKDDEVPERVGSSLARVLGGLGEEVPTLVALAHDWQRVCGCSLVDHLTLLRLEDGVLVVGVDQPARTTQVRFAEKELLDRAGAVVGHGRVRSIRVVLRSQ